MPLAYHARGRENADKAWDSARGEARGRVYVLLGYRLSTEQPHDHTAELIATVREQLQPKRQGHAEARRLLAAALERIPPQLKPGASTEPSESPEPRSEGSSPSEAASGAQEGAERPWWRRVLGG
jgi:hypothetical protein